MEKVRVLIADDHALVREGLRLMLERQPDFRVVGEAATGREAVRLALRTRPDVVLLDITMPDLDGIETLKEIHRHLPQVRGVILTMHEDRDLFFQALQVGAMGYVLKGGTSEELLTALRVVQRGEVYLSPRMATVLVQYVRQRGLLPGGDGGEPRPEEVLSPREIEVLTLLAQGRTNQEIAATLTLSPSTVQTYRSRILEKLGAQTWADLVKYAVRHGLIGME